MDDLDNDRFALVIVFAVLLLLALSNRQLIPYVNANRGFKGPRTPKGIW